MAKQNLSLYEQLNFNLNTLYSYNFLVKKLLEQAKKADELFRDNAISYKTNLWINNKHKICANLRAEYINHVNNNMEDAIQLTTKNLNYAKDLLWEEFKKLYPDNTKKFEECFDGNIIKDERLVNRLVKISDRINNGENVAPEMIDEKVNLYLETNQQQFLLNEYKELFDVVCAELTLDGYNAFYNKVAIEKDVKHISIDSIYLLERFAKQMQKTINKDLLKTSLNVKKMENKIEKAKSDKVLKNLVEELKIEKEVLTELTEKSEIVGVLNQMCKTYADRAEAANSKVKFNIVDEIYMMLADFGLSVPENVKKKEFLYDKFYMTKSEVDEVLDCSMAFPEAAKIVQKIAYDADVYKKYELADFNESIMCIEELSDIHKTNLNYVVKQKAKEHNKTVESYLKDANENELNVEATKPEISKHLLFSTPVGVVWFDGVNTVNAKTGEIVPLSEIKQYFLNEDEGQFYKITKEFAKQFGEGNPLVKTFENRKLQNESSTTNQILEDGRKM